MNNPKQETINFEVGTTEVLGRRREGEAGDGAGKESGTRWRVLFCLFLFEYS